MEQEMNNRSIGKKALITFFVIVILLSGMEEAVENALAAGLPG